MKVIVLCIIGVITLIACDGDYTLADGNNVIKKKQDQIGEKVDSASFFTIEKDYSKSYTPFSSIREKDMKILRNEIAELKDKIKKLKKVKKYNFTSHHKLIKNK